MAHAIKVQVDWGRTGAYTDESSRVESARGEMRMSSALGGITGSNGIIDTCTITMDNRDGRFSPERTDSPLYGYIAGGGAYQAPVVVEVSVESIYHRVFVGHVRNITDNTTSLSRYPTVELVCRSRDDALVQVRASTLASLTKQILDEGWSEDMVIAKWLQLAGLVDGVDFVSQAYAAANPSYTATIEPGMFTLPMAWLDDESVLEDVWGIAAACGGHFLFMPDDVSPAPSKPTGSFVYWNAAHLANTNAPSTTLDNDDYAHLDIHYDAQDLYSSVSVEVSPRDVYATDVVWEPDDVPFVPPNSTKAIVAELQHPTPTVDSISYTAVTPGGKDITSDVTITYTAYTQRVEMTVTNANATHQAVLTELSINGTPVYGGVRNKARVTSSDSFWSNRIGRGKLYRGNEYVQTPSQASLLANLALARVERPLPTYRATGIFPGRPQWRVGQRLSVQHTGAMSSTTDVVVSAITWRYTHSGGFVQDVTGIPSQRLYAYMKPFDSHGYFIVGQSKLGTNVSSSSPGRFFY